MKSIESILDEEEKSFSRKHWDGYYSFTRQIISLSAGALALAVLLQKNYVPEIPQYLWLLKCSWVLFFLTLLFGLLSLYGQVQIPLDCANTIRQSRRDKGDEETGLLILQGYFLKTRMIFRLSFDLMAFCFLLAFFLLSLFAICN